MQLNLQIICGFTNCNFKKVTEFQVHGLISTNSSITTDIINSAVMRLLFFSITAYAEYRKLFCSVFSHMAGNVGN
jgi:hypothetical protein